MKTAIVSCVLTAFLYLFVGFHYRPGFFLLGLTCGAFISGVLVQDELLKMQARRRAQNQESERLDA